MPLELAQGRRIAQRAEGAQRAAQPPQADAQLVGGVGVVGLQHGARLAAIWVGGRLHDEAERLRAGVVGREHRLARRAAARRGRWPLPERQAVAALGLAGLGQADRRRGEQLGGRLQQALRAAGFQLQLGLAQAVLGACRRARRLRRAPAQGRPRPSAAGASCADDGLEHGLQDRRAPRPSGSCGECGGRR